MAFGLSIFFIAFNLFIRIFFNLTCSMGDNLLFMDSPAPSARTSVLQGSQTNEDQTLLEQADSPCGVDKLLNFSPSEIAKVRLKILLKSFGSMSASEELCTHPSPSQTSTADNKLELILG